MFFIAEQFAIIIAGLRVAIAEHTVRDRLRTPLLVIVWGRVGRMAQRFEALFARWRAGTLPKPRPSRAGQVRPAREQPGISPRIPSGRTWLVAIVGYQAAGRGSQLQHLLAHPDMAEFLAAAPQAGRILRPLCHMLGLPATALPSRPVAVLPPRPATEPLRCRSTARPALAPQPSTDRPARRRKFLPA